MTTLALTLAAVLIIASVIVENVLVRLSKRDSDDDDWCWILLPQIQYTATTQPYYDSEGRTI